MKFVLGFMLSLSLITWSSAQDASDIVRWDQKTIHLGQVVKGETPKSRFTFTNISNQNIEIDLVSTCDCTEAQWTMGIIQPREKGTIDFVFLSDEKDREETIDIDVYFVNIDPVTNRPYSSFLSYTYTFK